MSTLFKLKLTLVLLVANQFVFGQQDTLKPKFSKFALGFSFAPELGYRYTKTSADYEWLKNSYDTLEKRTFTYSTGVNLNYHFSEKLTFGSGLLFSNKGVMIKENRELNIYEIRHNYNYLAVPLRAQYAFLTKKSKVYATAGLLNNILLNANAVHINIDRTITTKFDMKSQTKTFNLAYFGGVGIDLKLTEKAYFKAEAVYQQALTALAATPVKRYPYSIGTNFALFLKLK